VFDCFAAIPEHEFEIEVQGCVPPDIRRTLPVASTHCSGTEEIFVDMAKEEFSDRGVIITVRYQQLRNAVSETAAQLIWKVV
jgi:hypothetical protein